MPNVAFPAGLSHDRYLIYEMMGQQVSFTVHNRKENKKVTGVTEQVCRDIFENQIELIVSGKTYRFKEPNVISKDPDTKDIVFVYGKPDNETEMSDKVLFAEVRAVPFKGETIDDVIHRTKQGKIKVLKFALTPAPVIPHRRHRN